MKHLLITLMLSTGFISLLAQQISPDAPRLLVCGDLKQDFILTLSDLEELTQWPLPDMRLTNHRGEIKSTLTEMTGISIREILRKAELNEDNPKKLNEFYFVFEASDKYRVVFSWNELFNSPTGDQVWIVTSLNGKKFRDMDDTILLICRSDIQTGRRHIKNLSRIIVARTNLE